MRLITSVNIHGFRSIQDQGLENLGGLNAVVGKNSSGKSNLLRALHLFFHGEPEPGMPLSFARDHHQQIPRLRRKKRISITVTFDLPDTFRVRRELANLEPLGRTFSITRQWELDARRNPIEHLEIDGDLPDSVDRSNLARQFLALIHYRYIPNRTVPAHLLKHESQALANSIFLRMKGDQHAEALLGELDAAAGRWLRPAAEAFESSGSPLGSPTVVTGETLGEMLTMSGFRAIGPHGAQVQDEDWGAGHQGFFLFHVLRAIDTDYGKFFGWRQATVWGIEEPESALHRDLETRLADGFRRWALDPKIRLQVILTTHSPVFTMAADTGYWCEVNERETTIAPTPIPTLARDAETKGVSGWMHPILSFPWNPVVMVEGKIDVAALQHVAETAGLDHLRFLTMPQLDPRQASPGKSDMARYLTRHRDLIGNRQAGAPLVVLVDWEVSNQDLDRIRKGYGVGGDRFVLRMDPRYADARLGADFKGIERFYPPRILEEAHEAGEVVLGKPVTEGRPWSISGEVLKRGKNFLLQRFLRLCAPEDLRPILLQLRDVETALLGGSPFQLTLPGIGERSASRRQD